MGLGKEGQAKGLQTARASVGPQFITSWGTETSPLTKMARLDWTTGNWATRIYTAGIDY